MYLQTIDMYQTAETWAAGFIEQLLQITHAPPAFQADGRCYIMAEYVKIESTVKELMWTDPDDLLKEDCALLSGNFYKLGKSLSINQWYRIA